MVLAQGLLITGIAGVCQDEPLLFYSLMPVQDFLSDLAGLLAHFFSSSTWVMEAWGSEVQG